MLRRVSADASGPPSLRRAAAWRLTSVTLLSLSSGLPLGLVWIAIPAWMARIGTDIRIIGLLSLAQLPWSFKFLWSPLVDRYPLPFLGRKRGWMLASQISLLALGLLLARASTHVEALGPLLLLALATAFVSATQDIAIDGYAVEVLHHEEYGAAVGTRLAAYRAAMLVSGGVSITVAARTSWTAVNLVLALCYVPLILLTILAPEPDALPPPPRSLREATWAPFVGLLSQNRALEVLAFVVLYKLGDQLATALIRPFLVQQGFNDFDVGVGSATVDWVAMVAGTLVGGLLTRRLGLGRGLWIFGITQLGALLGYALLAEVGVDRPLMYAAKALEMSTSGMANGAFGVLLLRLTAKRFSATQYALLSSLFSLPRVLVGPLAGIAADALGWRNFFVLTAFAGLPGLWMLRRFVPWGAREPALEATEPASGRVTREVVGRAALLGVLGSMAAALMLSLLASLRSRKAGRGFDPLSSLLDLMAPQGLVGWCTLAGVLVFGAVVGLGVAAFLSLGMREQDS